MNSGWQKNVLRNFEQASKDYNVHAKLQRAVAWRLAKHCSRNHIPLGYWIDLGSGTGLLADALEICTPLQTVLRVDGSRGMLALNRANSQTQQWDLNLGLPACPEPPTLLASSFTLQWLSNPQYRIEEWFKALAPKGWLALALPVDGSFPQWQDASITANVPYTALPLPSKTNLLNGIPKNCIRYQRLHNFTQRTTQLAQILKPIRKAGSQASYKQSLRVGEWRLLNKAWNRSKDNNIELTWRVLFLLLQR